MKAVLDTNVLISAFLWSGTSKEILVFVEQGVVTVCTTKEILDELERVLCYPKFEKLLAQIGTTPATLVGEFMEVAAYYPSLYFETPIIVADPADDHVLACALSANAEYIVSGDKHLTSLSTFNTIPILTPRQFLAVLTQ